MAAPAEPGGAITVIIPARDMTAHLAACLETLMPQVRPGDAVVVVDDASATDDVAAVAAAAGASCLRQETSRGPYVARHRAALLATTPYLLFVDTRTRPRPGYLDAHRRLLAEPGAAMSATAMRTESGSTYAARVAAFKRPLNLEDKIFAPDNPEGRLSFFPTCNLGVTTDAYLAVDGFRMMRSGADADLCWRIQLAGLGGIAAEDVELASWVPRAKWDEICGQWARYGDSSALLRQLYPEQGTGGAELPVDRQSAARAYVERAREVRPRDFPLAVGAALVHRHFTRALRAGLLKPIEEPTPIVLAAD